MRITIHVTFVLAVTISGASGHYHKRRYHDDSNEHTIHTDSQQLHGVRNRRQHPISQPSPQDSKVYRFAISENYGAYEYTDAEGYAKGFNIDLIKAVCAEAGKTCYFMMDRHTRCWETQGGHEYPGEGLMAGWYDGCVGLSPSPERMNAFKFSLPYTTNSKAALYYQKGSALLGNEGVHNLVGHKIGFIDGWAVSQRCLERQLNFAGNKAGDYEAVMYDSHETMLTDLMINKLDAVLTVDSFDADRLGLKHAEPMFECTTGGSSLMARYGDPVIDWWDAAFTSMLRSGKYTALCNQATTEHGFRGKIACFTGDEFPVHVNHPNQVTAKKQNYERVFHETLSSRASLLYSGCTLSAVIFACFMLLTLH